MTRVGDSPAFPCSLVTLLESRALSPPPRHMVGSGVICVEFDARQIEEGGRRGEADAQRGQRCYEDNEL